jgi:hypothetical protein
MIPHRDSVPCSVIAPLIQEWLDSDPFIDNGGRFISGNTYELLAERAGMTPRRLNTIKNGGTKDGTGRFQDKISFDAADRILCVMHMQSRWLVELAEFYGPISVLPYEYDFEQPVTESPCGTAESREEGCRCKPCRRAHDRLRLDYMREYKRQQRAVA